jgi:hypothetical protein
LSGSFSEEVFRQKTEKEDFFSNEAFQPISLELEKKYAALSDFFANFSFASLFPSSGAGKKICERELG